MEIRQYNYDDRIEYSKFIRKYNKSKCLDTLNIQTFFKGKTIYLILEKTFFNIHKIIGYAIVYEELNTLYLSNEISKKYDEDSNTIFISDFMIDYLFRNQGIGQWFAKYILYDKYKDKNIILQPDGDGNWFWKKFGFIPYNISNQLTLILKRNNELP